MSDTQPTIVINSSPTIGLAFVALAIVATGLGGVWLLRSEQGTAIVVPTPGPSPAPAPVVVPTFPLQALSDALRSENNPARVKLLRDLWGGLAATTDASQVDSMMKVQQVNQLAGRIAGLDGINPTARGIVSAQFGQLQSVVGRQVDATGRARVVEFYRNLEAAAQGAL